LPASLGVTNTSTALLRPSGAVAAHDGNAAATQIAAAETAAFQVCFSCCYFPFDVWFWFDRISPLLWPLLLSV